MMTEVEKLFDKMQQRDIIKTFERDYGMCFLQESADISTDLLTFSLNHCTMSFYNYYNEDDEDYVEDCLYFDDFGTGIDGLPFNCTEDEFNNHNLDNKHIQYSDMKIIEKIYNQFEKYLDMDAVKKYHKKTS